MFTVSHPLTIGFFRVRKQNLWRGLLKVSIRSRTQRESIFRLLASCRSRWVRAYNIELNRTRNEENSIQSLK